MSKVVVALAVTAALAVGVAGGILLNRTIVSVNQTSNNQGKENGKNMEQCPELPVDQGQEKPEECPQLIPCKGCVKHPAYSLKLGATGYLSVPEGWYVKKLVSDWDEINNTIKNQFPESLKYGVYPIHKKFQLVLTNDASTITVTHTYQEVAGPFGMESEPLPAGYTRILNPAGGKPGIARKRTGDNYSYITFEACTEEPLCGEWAVVSGNPYNMSFVFNGTSVADLNKATAIFKEGFIDGHYKPRE